MKTFATQRLILRDWNMDDLEELHRLIYADVNVAHFYAGGVKGLDYVREMLAHVIWLNEHESDQGWACWAVALKEDGRMVGRVNLGRPDRTYYHVLDPDDPYVPLDVEIGYAFGKAYWGKGYAFEACRAVIEYAFKELRIKRIVIGADLENRRSIRLLERLGFTRGRNHHLDYPGYVNILENDLTRP